MVGTRLCPPDSTLPSTPCSDNNTSAAETDDGA